MHRSSDAGLSAKDVAYTETIGPRCRNCIVTLQDLPQYSQSESSIPASFAGSNLCRIKEFLRVNHECGALR